MREFNALPSSTSNNAIPSYPPIQPLVYTTYQAYLRRTPLHVAYTLNDARRNNYALGVKLVRGAYHPYELAAHESETDPSGHASLSISPEALPPVWLTKPETDKAYNDCVKLLVEAVKQDISECAQPTQISTTFAGFSYARRWIAGLIKRGRSSSSIGPSTDLPDVMPRARQPNLPGIGVLFGTHNWDSCNLFLNQLIDSGLGTVVTTIDPRSGKNVQKVELSDAVTERIAIGQLYGT